VTVHDILQRLPSRWGGLRPLKREWAVAGMMLLNFPNVNGKLLHKLLTIGSEIAIVVWFREFIQACSVP
jgi:hypothetical protein